MAQDATKTMTSSLEPLRRSSMPTIATEAGRNEQITTLLVRLGSHYYRPDFGPAQVKFMVLDFLEDLSDFTVAQIEVAIRDYRRNLANKFFPTPAQLLAILRPAPDPSDKPRRLPTHSGYPEPVRKEIKSVAQVLREHGFERAANSWEARIGNGPK